MFFRSRQELSPLNAVLLELAAKSEAMAPTLTAKNERALLLARCGAVRKWAGDAEGAAARAGEVKALLTNLNTDEDGALDHTKLASELLKAGDSEGAAAQFTALKKSADNTSLESLKLSSLREIAGIYHEAGDDKMARTILRPLAAEIKRVDGADSSAFALALYSLAEWGDPDTAEQLAPQHKEAETRAVVLRKAALALQKTNPARAKALMRRALAISLADKAKTPGAFHGHIETMAVLEMKAETEALIAKLPTLFPKKSDREALAPMLVTCYGAVGNFSKAIQLAEKLPGKAQNGKLTDLMEQAVRQKNTPVLEQLIQRIHARVAQDPETKKDPSIAPGVRVLSDMYRLGLSFQQGKLTTIPAQLRALQSELEKFTQKDAYEKAAQPLGIAELAIGLSRTKG
jgi:hypothetical protein